MHMLLLQYLPSLMLLTHCLPSKTGDKKEQHQKCPGAALSTVLRDSPLGVCSFGAKIGFSQSHVTARSFSPESFTGTVGTIRSLLLRYELTHSSAQVIHVD